jgi:hypothetical protein
MPDKDTKNESTAAAQTADDTTKAKATADKRRAGLAKARATKDANKAAKAQAVKAADATAEQAPPAPGQDPGTYEVDERKVDVTTSHEVPSGVEGQMPLTGYPGKGDPGPLAKPEKRRAAQGSPGQAIGRSPTVQALDRDALDDDEDDPGEIAAERAASYAPVEVRQPSDMSKDELLAYVSQLESQVGGLTTASAGHDPYRTWDDPNEIVVVDIPVSPSGHPVTINGVPYEGRMEVTVGELAYINEKLASARISDAARLAYRGNVQDRASVVMSPLDQRISATRTSRSGALVGE